MSALAFRKHMKEKMNLLGVEDAMVNRYVNQGFSGGEKKRNEICSSRCSSRRSRSWMRPTPVWTSTR